MDAVDAKTKTLVRGFDDEFVAQDPKLRDEVKCHGSLEEALSQRYWSLWTERNELGVALGDELSRMQTMSLDLSLPKDRRQKTVQDEIFQCAGQLYDAIDLRTQFGPTRDQGSRGTCVAHAVADAFVAMGSRLGVAVNDIHPLGLALGLEDCKARSGWTDGRHHIRGRVHMTDKWPELGFPNLGFMDGSFIDEDLERLQESGLMTVSTTHRDSIESVFDRMNNGLTQRLRFKARGAPACDFSDKVDLAHEHVKSVLGRLKKQGVIVPKPVPDWDWSTLWKDIPSNDVLEAKASPCSLKDPKTLERLRSISKSLCQGYPIISGSRFPKGSEIFENGRWTLMPPLPPEQKNVGHAMLLVGMERASPDHQGYLIFRNSWEKGQSYLRIPIDQVCSIDEAYVVRGRKEPKPLSRQQCRWMKDQLICSPEALADEKPIGPTSTASPQTHSKPGAAKTP